MIELLSVDRRLGSRTDTGPPRWTVPVMSTSSRDDCPLSGSAMTTAHPATSAMAPSRRLQVILVSVPFKGCGYGVPGELAPLRLTGLLAASVAHNVWLRRNRSRA
jgi:hypothetical protein